MTTNYDDYSDSGVMWLGEIPSHWKMAPLWSMFHRKKDTDHPAETMLSVFREYGVVAKESRENINQTAENRSIYQLVQPGWLVANRMKAWQGSVGISGLRGIVSGHYICFAPQHQAHDSYLNWLFRSPTYATGYALLSRGVRVGQAEIDNDQYRVMPVLIPPIEEQHAIADYLDRETAQIDTLIEEQQRLIKVLRERRQAAIESAVFLGRHGAETGTNDEGWLPSTPRHWKVLQLGFVTDTLAGWAFPSGGFTEDDSHTRLLRGINVKPGRTDWSETIFWHPAAPVPEEFRLEVGDLVLGMDRPFVNGGVRIAAITDGDLPSLLLQRVMRIRPTVRGDRGYFRYMVSTGAFLAYLEPLFTGVSVPHMSEWQVRKFKMPLPPLEEQQAIAAYLDEQTAKIDTLIAETERFIDLSRERRSALIAAAVTGQIDVRGEVA